MGSSSFGAPTAALSALATPLEIATVHGHPDPCERRRESLKLLPAAFHAPGRGLTAQEMSDEQAHENQRGASRFSQRRRPSSSATGRVRAPCVRGGKTDASWIELVTTSCSARVRLSVSRSN